MSTAPLLCGFNSVADDPVHMAPDPRKAKITDENREESRRLKAIWDAASPRPSQAVFAEEFDIGGQSAVNNFLNGKSALSIKAARGFARGLGCEISDFSPRLGLVAADLGTLAAPRENAQRGTSYSVPLIVEELTRALTTLSRALDTPDKISRAQVELLISLWLKDRSEPVNIARRIALLLEHSDGPQLSPHDERADKSVLVFDVPTEGEKNGTGDSAEQERSARGG